MIKPDIEIISGDYLNCDVCDKRVSEAIKFVNPDYDEGGSMVICAGCLYEGELKHFSYKMKQYAEKEFGKTKEK